MASAESHPEQRHSVSSRLRTLLRDTLAGFTVALILIPQSLAYAELAGLPAVHGLYAAALPPLAAALFASSPTLQTGPVALTAILSFGVLAPVAEPGSAEFVAAAALLALIVGVTRVLIGVFRLGGVAYLMSQPVVMGFTSAATLLILSSQLPSTLGVTPPVSGIVAGLGWTLMRPGLWHLGAVLLSLVTLLLMVGGKRLTPLFPGVLVAALVGLGATLGLGYDGPLVGGVEAGFPPLSLLTLPWGLLPTILLGGMVIAVVGFAEVASIARTFVIEDRGRWDPHREFISQGAANLAAGLFGGFPVGGSFSRSSLSRLAGAQTRWSGAITGLIVLALTPLVGVLAYLPRAILGAVVIGAVLNLIRLRALVRLWRYSRGQAAVAWATFGLTLALSPRIDQAIVIGIGLAITVHLWREWQLELTSHYADDALYVQLSGVLWFGSAPQAEEAFALILETRPKVSTLVINTNGVGRIDLSGAMVLSRLVKDAQRLGLTVEMQGLSPRTAQMLERLNTPPT